MLVVVTDGDSNSDTNDGQDNKEYEETYPTLPASRCGMLHGYFCLFEPGNPCEKE